MKRRSGFSLVELLFVCTLTTLAVILGSQILLLLNRTEAHVREEAGGLQRIARLGRDFRADVHAARVATVKEECRLDLPDGIAIVYTAEKQTLVRRVERQGEVESREAYALPRGTVARFARQDAEVSLEIVAAANEHAPRGVRPWSITSQIGLHDQILAAARKEQP